MTRLIPEQAPLARLRQTLRGWALCIVCACLPATALAYTEGRLLVEQVKASQAFEANNYQEARAHWQKMADQGDAIGLFNLAMLQMRVEGTSAEVVSLLREAAYSGMPEAQNNLGVLYEEGNVLARDLERALKYYERGAYAGLPEAQYNAGRLLLLPHAYFANRSRGIDNLQNAAYQGLGEAMLLLAETFLEQPGEQAKGIYWLKEAANVSQRVAQYQLAVAYLGGLWGMPRDIQSGLYWLQLSGVAQEHGLNVRQAFSPFEGGMPEDFSAADMRQARAASLEQAQMLAPESVAGSVKQLFKATGQQKQKRLATRAPKHQGSPYTFTQPSSPSKAAREEVKPRPTVAPLAVQEQKKASVDSVQAPARQSSRSDKSAPDQEAPIAEQPQIHAQASSDWLRDFSLTLCRPIGLPQYQAWSNKFIQALQKQDSVSWQQLINVDAWLLSNAANHPYISGSVKQALQQALRKKEVRLDVNSANLRNAPGTESRIIGWATGEDSLYKVCEQADWVLINHLQRKPYRFWLSKYLLSQ